ncbi:TPA: hypothetical protein SB543_000062 [Campylobacter jejuni]|nr:hypothetical protein [Campylobacter jejuni]EAL0530811.1 hypothetical protein [Campylobacter jejuni]ECL6530541.1 hypothetical protein [Campylobacter jejuni]ECO3479899.1 hypothetical protein [Campylobacter jejuni]ECR2478895.1 hypothetical protein [Campylobacter jejuni]
MENKFKINYDQTTTNGRNGTNGKVDNLSMKNHHLKSIGHSPDIFGLFVSIVNQFTNTSTFVSNGKIDNKKLEKYLDDTCKILLIEAHNKSKPFKEILK